MNTSEVKARIEENWQLWKLLPKESFYRRRMDFFHAIDLPDNSWYNFKHILEIVIAEQLEKEGK